MLFLVSNIWSSARSTPHHVSYWFWIILSLSSNIAFPKNMFFFHIFLQLALLFKKITLNTWWFFLPALCLHFSLLIKAVWLPISWSTKQSKTTIVPNALLVPSTKIIWPLTCEFIVVKFWNVQWIQIVIIRLRKKVY